MMEITAQAIREQTDKVSELAAIRDAAIESYIVLIDGGVTLVSHSAKIVADACYHVEKERKILEEMQSVTRVFTYPEKCDSFYRGPIAPETWKSEPL